MNGKKGSVQINILFPANVVPSDVMKKPNTGTHDDQYASPRKWILDVWKFAMADLNRVTFAMKVGLACLLVSLLVLIRAPYDIFGTNIIWSILTVAIMFEYTVGATFNRGFNRALGSLLAGVFALVVMQAAISCGHIVEPYVIGFSIFLIGAITSFMKLWPSLVPYEYGFRVILFTYCLIVVSGYRIGTPLKTTLDRLYSIAIGGVVAVLVNVLICPIWAGEQLHNELVTNFKSIADSLEECVKKYLKDDGSEHPEFTKTVIDDFLDEPAYKNCRATLNSSAKLDSLASSAKWEPPHGRFRHFFYPWGEYVKVGAVLRHCAYEVMALHGCLHSEIQAPYNLRCAFQSEILDATNQAAELLRSLAKDISNMKHNRQTTLLKRVHSSTEHLQRSVYMHSYLLTSCHESCSSLSKPQPPTKLHNTLSLNLKSIAAEPQSSKLGNAHSWRLQAVTSDLSESNDKIAVSKAPPLVAAQQVELYHEAMKRQQRRLYSWPSREVDEFDEEVGADLVPRMRALESTTALSLATFTSLLIEFVARLDHLVEAVEELAKLAKFKHDELN